MSSGVLPGSIRALARLAMPSLVRSGLSSNAIISALRAEGLTYRRATMLSDIRSFSGMLRLEGAVRSLPGDRLPTANVMVESDFRSARRYLIRGRLTVEDTETGEVSERYVSFFSNDLATKDSWSSQFIGQYAGQMYRSGELILDLQIASIEHKAGWEY